MTIAYHIRRCGVTKTKADRSLTNRLLVWLLLSIAFTTTTQGVLHCKRFKSSSGFHKRMVCRCWWPSPSLGCSYVHSFLGWMESWLLGQMSIEIDILRRVWASDAFGLGRWFDFEILFQTKQKFNYFILTPLKKKSKLIESGKRTRCNYFPLWRTYGRGSAKPHQAPFFSKMSYLH